MYLQSAAGALHSHNALHLAQTTTLKRVGVQQKKKKKKERKNIFSSLSNLHDAEAEVKLKASCLELLHAKIAFFGENSLATDCFAVRDINPCRVIIVLSLCSTAPLFFPQFILVDFFYVCDKRIMGLV